MIDWCECRAGLVASAMGIALIITLCRCAAVFYRLYRTMKGRVRPLKVSYITCLTKEVLTTLSDLGLWQILRRQSPEVALFDYNTDAATDSFVILNLVLSFANWLLVPPSSALAFWLLLYGLWQVYGIVMYELKVVFADTGPLESYRRLAILSLLNYVQILLWFAAIRQHLFCVFGGDEVNRLQSLFFSLSNMTFMGVNGAQRLCTLGQVLVLVQVSTALTMTLVVLTHSVGALRREAKRR